MTTKQTTILNGVNVTRLGETMDVIRAAPAVAKFQFRADGRWLDGGHNRTTIREFHGACRDLEHERPFVLDADEPDLLLGTDLGANPVEYVLAGLAGCLTTSLVYHAAARGIRVEEVALRLEGDLDIRGLLGMDPAVRNGYEAIRVTMRVKADGPPETVDELVRIAQARSPVFDIVSHGVPVIVRAEHAEEPDAREAAVARAG